MRGILLACAAAATALGAQDPAVIRVDTRLVQVDVIVRNGKGPVRNLTKDDFTLTDHGRQQKISLFRVTEAHQSKDAVHSLPPGVVSNRLTQSGEAPGSVTVILIDRLNTPPEIQPYADRELIRFLQSARKGDPIAIYGLGGQLRVIQDFTTDLGRLIEAASHINLERPMDLKDYQLIAEVAAALQGTNGETMHTTNTKALEEMAQLGGSDSVTATTRALSEIAKHLAGVPGRKNLVWISASFPLLAGGKGRGSIARDFTPEIQKASRSLNEANVAVYPVDARGLVAGFGGVRSPEGMSVPDMGLFLPGLDTMNTLASWTGGQAFYATNDLQGAIREAIDDGEVTYTLGFYPSVETLDGTYHELHVKVAKGGGEVRYRKGYYASASSSPTQAQLRDGLKEALRSVFDATAIGLTASGEPDASAPGILKATVRVNVGDLQMERSDGIWTGSVAVAFRAESDQSPSVNFVTVPMKLSEAQYSTALKDGFALPARLNVGSAPGRTRAVVQDQNTGAVGSIWIPGTK